MGGKGERKGRRGRDDTSMGTYKVRYSDRKGMYVSFPLHSCQNFTAFCCTEYVLRKTRPVIP